MSEHRLPVEDLPVGEVRRVVLDGLPLCVARLPDGSVRAVHDACTHYRVRLSRGELVGDDIECPAHGSLFSMVTGEVRGLPAYEALRTYPVRVAGGEVLVDIGAGAPAASDRIDEETDDDLAEETLA